MAYDRRGHVSGAFGSAPRSSRSKSASGGSGLSPDYAPAYGAREFTGYSADDMTSRSLTRSRRPSLSSAYSDSVNRTLVTSLDDLVPYRRSGLSRSRSRYSDWTRHSDDGAARSRSFVSVESRRPLHLNATSGLTYGPARALSTAYYPPLASRFSLAPSSSPHPARDYEDRRRVRRQSTTTQCSELAMFPFEHDDETSAGASRLRRPIVFSSGLWNLGHDGDKPSSRVWGPASSLSRSPGDAAPMGRHPLLSSTYACRSSRTDIVFERGSGEHEFHSSLEGHDVQGRGRGPRPARHAQIHPTSFKSGFSDNTIIDGHGEFQAWRSHLYCPYCLHGLGGRV